MLTQYHCCENMFLLIFRFCAVLEAYTLQLDYYLAQLDDLSADIEEFWVDTQQELGRKRNSLFALQILVNTVTMGFSFVSMVGAIFGT